MVGTSTKLTIAYAHARPSDFVEHTYALVAAGVHLFQQHNSHGTVPFLPEDDTSRILAAREDFIGFWLASQPPYLTGLNAVAGLQDPTKMLAERAWLRVPLSIRPLIGRDDESTFVGSIASIPIPLC